MFISIIIVSHNTKRLLLDCLESLRVDDARYPYEIIVVDNASTDGSQQAVSDSFPHVVLLQNQDNRGFGAANNQGAKIARGELLLFLNSDTLASPQAIQILASAFISRSKLAAVAPQLVGADGKKQETVGFLMTPLTETWASAKRQARKQLADALVSDSSIAGVGYLSGAALMVRHRAFDLLGGFDESIFFYYEDADLCKRFGEADFEIKLVPQAVITHLGGSSTAQIPKGAAIELMRSRVQFIRKHFGKRAAIVVGCVRFLEHLRKALTGCIANVVTLCRSARIYRRTAMHWGICLWFIMGMPPRESRLYRWLFYNWSGR